MPSVNPTAESDAGRRVVGSPFFTTDGNTAGVWNMAGRYDGTFNKYGCAMRFALAVPQGATITAAALSLKTHTSGAGANAKTRIRAQKADNAGAFSNQSDFDTRIGTTNDLTNGVDSTKVTAAVDWDTLSASIADNTVITSPDIAAVIQAITDRPGWVSGNYIVLFWDDFDGRTATDAAYRIGWDKNAADASVFGAVVPSLSVTYSAAIARSGSRSGTGGGTIAKSVKKGGVANCAYVTTPLVEDTFVGTTNDNLSAHTPTGALASGSWADDTGASTDVLGLKASGSVGADDSVTSPAHDNSNGFAKHSLTPPADHAVEIDFQFTAGADPALDSAWALLRWNYSTEGLSVAARTGGIEIDRNAPSGALLATLATTIATGTPQKLRAEVIGNTIRAYLNDALVKTVTDPVGTTGPGKGGLRAGWQNPNNSRARITGYRLYTALAPYIGPTLRARGGGSIAKTFSAYHGSNATGTTVTHGNGTPAAVGRKGAQRAATCDLGRVITPVPMSAALAGSIATIAAASGASDSLNHNAFPGACLMPNGNHLVAWEHASQHAGTPSKILYAIVDPATKTITTGPSTLYTGRTGWNACDVSCWVDGTDVYVLFNESSTPRLANINTVVNSVLVKSSDNAASFGSPVAIPVGFDSNGAGVAGAYGLTPCPALVKPDGGWLLPAYGFDDKVALTGEYVKLRRSTDKGASWATVATFTPPAGVTGFDETAIVQFPDGSRALIFRTFVTSGATCLYISRNTGSDDTTWTTPTLLLSNAGGRPAVHVTAAGVTLLMYRYQVGGTVTGHTHLVWSFDNLATLSSPVDPYDGAAGRTTSTGYTSPPPMGLSVYGAFAPATPGGPDAVLYYSEEDSTTDTRAVLMARSVTTSGLSASPAQVNFTTTAQHGISRISLVHGNGAQFRTGRKNSRITTSVTGGGSPSFSYAKGPRATTSTTGGGLVLFNGATPVTPPPPLAFPASPYTPRLGPQGLWWEY